MGSVSSTNAGLSDLLQTLTNENSPLLSTLSSPNVEAALENAPAGDIAQISNEAIQLQMTDALFGESSPATTIPATSLGNQLAAYQGNSQLQEAQTLLGITQPTNPQSSLFDVFA